MIRRACHTDLSDAEWTCIENYLPTPKVSGPPKIHDSREILDAIFYVLRSGCAWRLPTSRLPALEDRLPLLQSLASGGHLGEAKHCSPRAAAGALGTRSATQCQHS